MFAALLYKEYREHRSIWLAMALFGTGGLVGVPYFFRDEVRDQELFNVMLGWTALIFVWAYGIVCGAMLLAGEREEGTQVFLDLQPTSRLHVWFNKALAGAIFVLLQTILLVGVAFMEHAFRSSQWIVWPLLLVIAGEMGFGWGVFCSALTRNVLGAIGLAILLYLLTSPIVFGVAFLVLAVLFFLLGTGSMEWGYPVVLSAAILLVMPFTLSALVYSRVDRGRKWAQSNLRKKRRSVLFGWSNLLWLTWRQSRGLFLCLLMFSLLAGFPAITKGLFVWPIITLLVSAFCGATIFLDEQSGSYRFIGEQRFPLGRIWIVKVGLRFLVVCLCALLVSLPAFIERSWLHFNDWHNLDRPWYIGLFGAPLVGELIPVFLFLILWPSYGFSVGTLCGVLFRRPLVAVVVSVGVSFLLVAVWAPSLVLGGLHFWQVIGPPLLFLVCSRVLMHPWAADRLRSWTTAGSLAIAVILGAALTTFGLWYRVVEFPDTPEPDDLPTFLASLPTPEENEAGRLIRTACTRLEERLKKLPSKRPLDPNAPRDEPARFTAEVSWVPSRGWPAQDVELERWLDDVFKDDWWKPLEDIARKPTGVVEDPRRLTDFSSMKVVSTATTAASLLMARGLQIQGKGNPEVFVDHLAVSFAIVRNLQNHGPFIASARARGIEEQLYAALTHWLMHLGDRADLLSRISHLIRFHLETCPMEGRDVRLAEYLIALNTSDDLASALQGQQIPEHEAQAVAVITACWHVPWEVTRRSRLLRTLHWDDRRRPDLAREIPFVGSFTGIPSVRVQPPPRFLLRRGIAELMIALRRFQADTGRPANRLDQLLPKYLTVLPQDPFDGRPIRYRLSTGEKIEWPNDRTKIDGPAQPPAVVGGGPAWPPVQPAQPVHNVPAGQGILWSIGEDRFDDGGKRQGLSTGHAMALRGEDLIFLVPLPARKP